jgi:hypothetical protein
MSVTVQVVEDGKIVESKPLPPDEYMVLCGERRYIDGVQSYPAKGTVVVTIKRAPSGDES